MKSSIYYIIHADKLPKEMGFDVVPIDKIAVVNGKYFTSHKKASQALNIYKQNGGAV